MANKEATLLDINGIALKTADKLATENITTVEQIRDISPEELDKLDVKLGLRGAPRLMQWQEQARQLVPPVVKDAAEVAPVKVAGPDDRDQIIAKLRDQLAEMSALKTGEEDAAVTTRTRRRRRLDLNQDVADVFGKPVDADRVPTSAAFMQVRDGQEVYFNHDGLEILKGETSNDVRSDDAEPEHVARELWQFHPINYLDGRVDYPLEFVRRAIQSRFGRSVKTVRHAKTLLHEQLRQNH